MVTISIILGLIQSIWWYRLWGDSISLIVVWTIVWFSGAFVSLFLSRRLAKTTYNIQLFDATTVDHKHKIVYDMVAHIANTHSMPIPEVGLYDSPEPNAFATGNSRSSALVAVSTWLLSTMDETQIRWIIGHEMAHILNGDMVTMTLVQWVVNTFVFVLARTLWWLISKRDDEWPSRTYFLIVPALEIVFWLLWWIITMRVSRTREYKADAWSASLLWVDTMLASLRKLESLQQNYTVKSDEFATLKFFWSKWFGSLRASHPPLADRIKALESMR